MKKPPELADIERPQPTYQDILERDGDDAPSVLRTERNPIPPTLPVALSRYTDQAFFNREMEKMWSQVWQFACREEHLPHVGSYIVYDIVGYI